MALGQQINGVRLTHLGLSEPKASTPAGIVARLAAVQAQDYYGAAWALGQRLTGAVEADVEAAFNRGDILRTHLLRPTWHFVTPRDIGWLLKLTGERVLAGSAYRHRQLELDAALFRRSDKTLAKTLADGAYLTRAEIGRQLEADGVPKATGQRLAYLVMHAELKGLICSGPRRGKQFTYALLDERAPESLKLSRPDALAELAGRYFATRGPASVQDFAKWSGLTLSTASEGLDSVRQSLTLMAWQGQELWFKESADSDRRAASHRVHLISIFDEYISSYRDRQAMAGDPRLKNLWAMGAALQYVILLDGRIVGTWKRTLERQTVRVQLFFDQAPSRSATRAAYRAAEEYARFVGRTADITLEHKG